MGKWWNGGGKVESRGAGRWNQRSLRGSTEFKLPKLQNQVVTYNHKDRDSDSLFHVAPRIRRSSELEPDDRAVSGLQGSAQSPKARATEPSKPEPNKDSRPFSHPHPDPSLVRDKGEFRRAEPGEGDGHGHSMAPATTRQMMLSCDHENPDGFHAGN